MLLSFNKRVHSRNEHFIGEAAPPGDGFAIELTDSIAKEYEKNCPWKGFGISTGFSLETAGRHCVWGCADGGNLVYWREKGGGGMRVDCHMHMVLDGVEWRSAIGRHREAVADAWVRKVLRRYQELGFGYLRDGGDRWGVGARARELAGSYGIVYRTPLAPLCKAGHYGAFIGKKYASFREFRDLVVQQRAAGADFVKIMISGLMDFDRFGVLSEPPLEDWEIRELVHIAHEEGFSVMAHANGARTVEAAALAGVDSVEHGAYLDIQALLAMKENGTVWVPTLSTVGNLRGTGRFDEGAVGRILDSALENVAAFADMGGLLAPGTDAGAWAVPHGSLTEYSLLAQALGGRADAVLERGTAALVEQF